MLRLRLAYIRSRKCVRAWGRGGPGVGSTSREVLACVRHKPCWPVLTDMQDSRASVGSRPTVDNAATQQSIISRAARQTLSATRKFEMHRVAGAPSNGFTQESRILAHTHNHRSAFNTLADALLSVLHWGASGSQFMQKSRAHARALNHDGAINTSAEVCKEIA